MITTADRQLVVLNGRLWVNPDGDAHLLQCIARTRRGTRCQNPVEHGQVLSFSEFHLGNAGYVTAYGSPNQQVDAERWLTQHCTVHDTPDVVDMGAPELRRFNIKRDAAFVQPHREDALCDTEPEARLT